MDDKKKKEQDQNEKGGQATQEQEDQNVGETSDLYGDMDEDTE